VREREREFSLFLPLSEAEERDVLTKSTTARLSSLAAALQVSERERQRERARERARVRERARERV